MWYDFQMHLGEGAGQQSPEVARQWIAGLANEVGEDARPDPAVFHADAAGRPRTGLSPIRFGAGKDLIRLYAVGETATDLLAREGHKITRLLSRKLGRPVMEVRQSGQCNIEPIPYLADYYVRAVGLKNYRWDDIKPLLVGRRVEGLTEPAVLSVIARTIELGIREQAQLLSLDGMGLDFDAPQDVLVEVKSVGAIVPLEVKPGSRRYHMFAQRVIFRLNLKLGGIWHVGRLASRGYGLIRQCRGIERGVQA